MYKAYNKLLLVILKSCFSLITKCQTDLIEANINLK